MGMGNSAKLMFMMFRFVISYHLFENVASDVSDNWMTHCLSWQRMKLVSCCRLAVPPQSQAAGSSLNTFAVITHQVVEFVSPDASEKSADGE